MKSKRAREAATEAVEDVLPLNDAPTEDKKKRKRSEDETGEQGKLKKAKKEKKDKTDKKKSKKGAFEETRREKKDKRKNLQDLPEEDADEEEVETQGDVAAPTAADASKSKKEKSASKSSKSSKSAGTDATNEEKTTVEKAISAQDGTEESNKKEKKKKEKKDKDEKSTTTSADDPAAETGKPSRHIVFVGNLPFSATAASIKAHFATLNPISVRCLKNKDDANPCRGIAFVEFANVWSMRTCLDKFHHTIFEDGVSAGRKINVELTAGGGGSTKFRKDKIREKNVKLDENRAKRIDKEKTAKQQSGGEKKGRQGKDAGVEAGVHPSRLARNPGLGGR
ncbi:hypothetical protein E4U57_002287 [Claviceps arundinis]|uniref:RRM domain-containing protein n=1 Tax=Claviceps arundinis TaxID=1623583 RepID=A0A9P7MT50_9HYPO|nr:hypothetical protein E4U57_002287 [Claviceps arundinis]KAG5968519.1 hypothetical protein E4U56_000344 [Claviceps arundinis]